VQRSRPTITLELMGVGDATDFALGQTSALYSGSCQILLDCGPQVPARVACSTDAERLDGVYITHTHADHCFGLPSLLLWLRRSGRTRSLSLFAEASLLPDLLKLVELGYPGSFASEKCFPIQLCPLVCSRAHACGAARFSIAPTEHSLPNFSLRIDDEDCAFAFSGDGRPNELTLRLFAGVDLLVHECALLEGPSQTHSDADVIADLLRTAAPRQVALVHCANHQRASIESRLSMQFGERVAFPRPGSRFQIPSR
jgi:ribonuclease BN (tRNA processing enzyme)